MALVDGDKQAPFLIATTLRGRKGRNSIPWIAPLDLSSLPYKLSVFVSRNIGEHSKLIPNDIRFPLEGFFSRNLLIIISSS